MNKKYYFLDDFDMVQGNWKRIWGYIYILKFNRIYVQKNLYIAFRDMVLTW